MKKIMCVLFFIVILMAACIPINTNTPDVHNTAIAIAMTDISLTKTAQPTATLIPVTITPSPLPTQLTVPVTLDSAQAEQQEEIKKVIHAYFDLRYQALSAFQPYDFQPDGFGDLISDGVDAKAFLDEELSKLALEIKYAQLNGSRYVDYKYFLDFSNFATDTVTQSVTVLVVEGNEIVSENSAKNDPLNPLVAQMSGLEHTIILRKEGTRWKIVSDYYGDFLWRTLRKNGESPDVMLNKLSTVVAEQVLQTVTPTP